MNKSELAKHVIAAKIKMGIGKKGLRKKEFGSIMGVSPSMITRWTSGTHNFTIDTLIEIENVLGIRVFYLGKTLPTE